MKGNTPEPNSESASGLLPNSLVQLKDCGVALEFMNEVWFNADRPLRLKDLRGKVLLIEFWIFG
jgi:hypothetical protein